MHRLWKDRRRTGGQGDTYLLKLWDKVELMQPEATQGPALRAKEFILLVEDEPDILNQPRYCSKGRAIL